MTARIMKLFLATGLFTAAAALPAWAQDAFVSGPAPEPFINTNPLMGVINAPQFFISIIAGILLSFGFQSVLTAFSVAVGLSSTPDLSEMAVKHRVRSQGRRDGFVDDDEDDTEKMSRDGSRAVRMTSIFGFWALATTSIALFFAAWLAVRLSFVGVSEIGLVLGLVIWAAFFVIMTYLELRTVRSAMGGIASLAFSGFRSTFDAAKSAITPSQNRRIEDASRQSVRAIYEEISALAQRDHLDRKLHDYLADLKPAVPDYDQIREDVRDLINHIKVEEKVNVSEEDIVRVLSLHLDRNGKYLTRENAEKLMDTARQATREAKTREGRKGKMFAAVETITPLRQKDVESYLAKIEDYLTRSGVKGLEPKLLRRDMEDIFAHPEASADIIRHRLNSVDEDSVRRLLINHPKVSEEDADKYTDMIMSAIGHVRERHTFGDSEKVRSMRKLPHKVEEKLATYFDSLGQPEINYEALKSDLAEILHEPAAAPRILRERLAQMDKGTVVALLSSNSHISEEQAEKIAYKALEVRDTVSEKIHDLESETIRRYNQMSRRAVMAAEHARESAIAASWWTVGTAMVSGIAAAVGGMLGAI